MEIPPTSGGFCITCGYPLQGLIASATGYRCPECGRAFDPANPKTFRNAPHSRLVRWLASPVGWPLVFASIAAAVGVMVVSRWKLSTFVPSNIDLDYYLSPWALRHRVSLVTWRDWLYTLSMLVAGFTFCWWSARLLARIAVRWWTDFQDDQTPTHAGRRDILLAIASLITTGGAALGWPYRLAQVWVARRLAAKTIPAPGYFLATALAPPAALSSQQTELTLRAAVIQLPQADQRMGGLKLLVEDHPQLALPILTEAVTLESDSEVRALELRLIAMHRDISTTDLLARFMTHPDAGTRAAAADAIGILHEPTFSIPLSISDQFFDAPPSVTVRNIPINLALFFELQSNYWSLAENEISLDISKREELRKMMLDGSSTEEREAAARALVVWSPEQYKLRVAEWGVWIDDHGELKLLQAVLDEIPGFVHRTGNPLAEFSDRVQHASNITKPIIHITVDRLLALDVNVIIKHGRPWFAYPKPDDFAVQVENYSSGMFPMLGNPQPPPPPPPPPPLSHLDNSAIEKLTDVRQGYPWLEPHHIRSGGANVMTDDEVGSIGVRWQSIIVSPTKLAWMTLPEVGTDPRFAWWARLREVPSAWVSSRGESERFLYYDGPTLLSTPVVVSLTGNHMRLALGKDWMGHGIFDSASSSPAVPQGAILIRHRNGVLSGQTISMPISWDATHTSMDVDLPDDNLQQDQVINQFRGMLKDAGLTAEEAEGLIASWQQQFFQTDGTRLLLIMSRQDYDEFCPIEIRPKPTELVRVGIVLTESL